MRIGCAPDPGVGKVGHVKGAIPTKSLVGCDGEVVAPKAEHCNG